MARSLVLLYAYKAYPKRTAPAAGCSLVELDANDGSYYANAIRGDCYVTLVKRWLEAGHIGQAKGVAIQYPEGHPRYSPVGVIRICEGFDFYILGDIGQYESIHFPSTSDILFIRGEAPWEPIVERHAASFKLFYNGAATDHWRPRYPVDAVLVDDPTLARRHERCIELVKCCDEDVFRPLGLPKTYDVCFVARFDRQDKKGQVEFARWASKSWKTVFVGETADQDAVAKVRRLLPRCEVVGSVSKQEVNTILNQSCVSVVNSRAHDACSRITVESLAAGTPVLMNGRNPGRKYITAASGVVSSVFWMRWKVGAMLRHPARFDPRGEYERRYHSRLVAERIWSQLPLGSDAWRAEAEARWHR